LILYDLNLLQSTDRCGKAVLEAWMASTLRLLHGTDADVKACLMETLRYNLTGVEIESRDPFYLRFVWLWSGFGLALAWLSVGGEFQHAAEIRAGQTLITIAACGMPNPHCTLHNPRCAFPSIQFAIADISPGALRAPCQLVTCRYG
jgi:hypothetical protein